jgi:REP element-mobilizing transposase RayT
MSRPLRIEFPGAVYHVTSRGDRRESIFVDDEDRVALLAVVGQGLERFDARMLAFCLMGNHCHFVAHTRRANLSLLMRHINGVYSQRFNRRHGLVGHPLLPQPCGLGRSAGAEAMKPRIYSSSRALTSFAATGRGARMTGKPVEGSIRKPDRPSSAVGEGGCARPPRINANTVSFML